MTTATDDWNTLLDPSEYDDVKACAAERGITVSQLMHDAIMDDLFR